MYRKPNILIVCYTFPPFPGVGGRRWAKFSKYLVKSGYKVHVVAAKNPFTKKSEWVSDIEGVEVTLLPLKYPEALILFPTSFIGRIKYKLSLMYVKLQTKGNYYDRAVFWREQVQSACRKIITKEDIHTVIVSGAPFSLFSQVSPLKEEFKHLRLIADVRDPWTSNATSYAFDKMSPTRLAVEQNEERTVFRHYDKVLLVNEHLTGYFRKLYQADDTRFITLPNGYDHEETGIRNDDNLKLSQDYINLAFTGTFYGQAQYLFKALIEALNDDRLQKFRFYFFGNGLDAIKNMVPPALANRFVFGYYSDVKQVNSLIAQCDLAMLFLTDDINYSLSTKFCEYIKFRKKTIVFSKPGFTAYFVTENKIGYHIGEDNMRNNLLKIVEDFENDNKFPETFNVEEFSIKNLTAQLTKLIDA